MDTTLQAFLKQRVANSGGDSVLRTMGYSGRALARARDRLQAVLADPDLGLGNGRYDFRFSDREFLRALAGTFNVETAETDLCIEHIEMELQRLHTAFKPWIFVETNFKRSAEPIFLLAWLESRRRLPLPAKAALLPRDELVAVAAERIREHYRKSRGQLPVWGVISEYKLVVSAAEQIVMDNEGIVQRVEPRCLGRVALLSLR